ncbi:MAG: sulfur carrier protein ThiS [Acidobacteria bacterium]|jgi:thiamine biosynthesis protein ThiS|nr:MAG: sulfur carrier protein ThiS [Acidobacteriota bacterium]GIU83050.1 MAG: sulfur carrier protein ThiS [Pyrinomonadaceae bacterium]
MQVIINGEKREVREGLSVLELLSELELPVERVAVEINKEVVRRQDWELTKLKENDRIEIVHFVGGG